MTGILTGFVGAVTEAWAQLRIGRLRVLLSLVGVAAAVAAMTFVIALGQVTEAAVQAEMEVYSGRPGTVTVTISPTGRGLSAEQAASSGLSPSGAASDAETPGAAAAAPGSTSSSASSVTTATKVAAAQTDFVDRYQVSSWATSYTSQVRFAFPDGGRNVATTVTTLKYGMLHRTRVAQGRWFTADDADDMSPSLIVSQGFLDQMGVSTLTEPLTITAYSPTPATYTIVGVLEPEDLSWCQNATAEQLGDQSCTQPVTAMVLSESYERWLPAQADRPIPTLEIWAGDQGSAQEMIQLARTDFDAAFGAGSTQTTSNSGANQQILSSSFVSVVTAAGVFVMILGALSLVNISLVTVRQRIHEIGVRRSFGATSRRIFFSIMLESVVATVVAGVVGIGIAIVGMRIMPLEAFLGFRVLTRPPFPMTAAIIGLVAAAGVGALAGIVPALVAVRIRPIDAIRY
ncbi:ABC transporter permease [Actinomyces oricola]|uniref:ABC transporter permease n=1 Tax=Actinomyces oricola TaxID=206043 RepID=UPI000FFED98F|nr:ABC transporter permease [Actinomyces oricola]